MSAQIESLRDTITPKSNQLNFDDLVSGPITVTVQAVKRGESPDQPVDVVIDGGYQPYKPCKSMRRILIAVWGENGNDWVGQSMTLYGDPSVKFGGVAVGGIRISHMTGIDRPRDLMLTTTRSKRSAYTVSPLTLNTAPAWTYDSIKKALAKCADMETLSTLTAAARVVYKTATKEQQSALTAAITAATKAASEQ